MPPPSPNRSPKVVLFYPDPPLPPYVLWKLCAILKYPITTDPRQPHDIFVKWRDITVFDLDPVELVKANLGNKRIINAGSLDIRKQTVAAAFAEVFGYPLEVEPTQFHGQIVEKSDQNCTHDGRILDGPLAKEDILPDRVYQRAINNLNPKGNLVQDFRVPLFGSYIPMIYLNYRPVDKRFAMKNSHSKLASPKAIFSSDELSNIITVAQKLGIDCGELDILRDTDGRIYVVDANNTPQGPPELSTYEWKLALRVLAGTFAAFVSQL